MTQEFCDGRGLDPSDKRAWAVTMGKQPRPAAVQAEGVKNIKLKSIRALRLARVERALLRGL